MSKRYGAPPETSSAARAIARSINLLSIIFAKIYYPTYSNGLKEIARFLGFQWREAKASRLLSTIWRQQWEESGDSIIRERLIDYNADDCEALSVVSESLKAMIVAYQANEKTDPSKTPIVSIDSLTRRAVSKWKSFDSPIPDLVHINTTAHWNYQRDRVFLNKYKSERGRRGFAPRRTRFTRQSPRSEFFSVWRLQLSAA